MTDRAWSPYCGPAPLPGEWLARWNGDPVLIVALGVVAVWAYRRGDMRWPFWTGLGLAAILFVSPFCALSSALFSARVVHHILLTAVAAPLLIWGAPRTGGRGRPAIWAAVHATLFWFWHAPAPYAFALSSDTAYWAMQVTLVGSALAFWNSLRAASAPLAIGLLLGMMVQMGLLGALITFAGAPLYAPHYLTTMAWGLSPIEDQQLAGLIMWAPAAGLYLGAALWTGWRIFPARAGVRA